MKINVNNVKDPFTAGDKRQFPRSPMPEIALSGRSNVGKSSLINTLLNRKSLARVSSAPGKTVTINYYNVDNKFYLVDLPGYGYAKRSQGSKKVFSSLTDDFFTSNPSIDALKLVIQLIDVRTGPSEDDCMMINYLIERDINFIVCTTKTDKLSKAQLAAALEKMNEEYFEGTGIELIPFSSVTKEGRDILFQHIESVLK